MSHVAAIKTVIGTSILSADEPARLASCTTAIYETSKAIINDSYLAALTEAFADRNTKLSGEKMRKAEKLWPYLEGIVKLNTAVENGHPVAQKHFALVAEILVRNHHSPAQAVHKALEVVVRSAPFMLPDLPAGASPHPA